MTRMLCRWRGCVTVTMTMIALAMVAGCAGAASTPHGGLPVQQLPSASSDATAAKSVPLLPLPSSVDTAESSVYGAGMPGFVKVGYVDGRGNVFGEWGSGYAKVGYVDGRGNVFGEWGFGYAKVGYVDGRGNVFGEWGFGYAKVGYVEPAASFALMGGASLLLLLSPAASPTPIGPIPTV